MAASVFTRLLLLLVALYATRSSCNELCDHWSPHFESSESSLDDANCYNPKKVGELGCWTIDPVVSWAVNTSDHDVGEMVVDFLLLNDPGTYKVTLEYSDIPKEMCHQGAAHFKIHSTRDFTVSSINDTESQNSSCEETGRAWFYYVYTGCYRVSFVFYPLKNEGVKLFMSCPAFMETSYVKKLLDKAPVLNSQYNHAHSTLRMTVEMGSEIKTVQVNVKLSSWINLDIGGDVCQKSGFEDVCCSYVPEESPQTLCRTSKTNHANTNCYIEDTSLVCVVGDVAPGDYCMMVSVKDDRCYQDTVWMGINNTYVCRWYLQFRANETVSDLDVVTVSADNWTKMLLYWCMAIMFVFILGCAAVAYWLYTKVNVGRSKDLKEIFFKSEYSPVNPKKVTNYQGPPEVLLLYALDCEPFMNLMTVFRNNLKKLGLKVHDCFDPECQERVARGPTQWLRFLLSRPEMKVVMVSSECARRRQLALDSCTPLCYGEPHPFSSLFICALEYITREGCREKYEREYHVRFHKFTEKRHMLAHVTPLRIYDLPEHFSELVRYLTNRCDIANTEVDIEDNNIFDEPLDKLVKYKTENPNYLDHLLLSCGVRSRREQLRLPSRQSADQEQR